MGTQGKALTPEKSSRRVLAAVALYARGYVVDRSARTTKYTVLHQPRYPDARKYFIGPSGAVRVGKNAGDSISLSDDPAWSRENLIAFFADSRYPPERFAEFAAQFAADDAARARRVVGGSKDPYRLR